jgi:hypothetical protein
MIAFKFKPIFFKIFKKQRKLANVKIFLVETSILNTEQEKKIVKEVDYYLNLINDKTSRNRTSSLSKSMGEATQTVKALEYIFKNNILLSDIEDAKFLKKPKGNEPQGEPGVMDDPASPNPEFQDIFYQILRVQEYKTRYTQMSGIELMESF